MSSSKMLPEILSPFMATVPVPMPYILIYLVTSILLSAYIAIEFLKAHNAWHHLSKIYTFLQSISHIGRRPVGGLSNAIHPIFRRLDLGNYGFNRNDIEPALRLASRFIELDGLLPIWYNLLLGHAQQDPASYGQPVQRFYFPHLAILTSRKIRETKEALASLSNIVDLRVEHLSPSVPISSNARPTDNPPVLGQRCGSTIKNDVAQLVTIRYARHFGDRDPESFSSVQLALVLIRALAGAAMGAGRGLSRGQQYYLPNCSTSHEGLETEVAILDGLLTVIRADKFAGWDGGDCDGEWETSGKMLLMEWPTPSQVDLQQSRAQSVGYEGKGELPKPDRGWEIQPAFLYTLLQDSYWETSKDWYPLRLLKKSCGWATPNRTMSTLRPEQGSQKWVPEPRAG